LDSFSETLHFVWADLGADDLAATTITGRDVRNWNGVRAHMQDIAFAEEDIGEYALTKNLPGNSTLSYIWRGGTRSTSNIFLPPPLLTKWYSISSGDPMLVEISNNAATSWDADARIGRPPVGANQYDLEGVLIHEIGHHFGFVCEAENIDNGVHLNLNNWDAFRVPQTAATGGISEIELQAHPREMRIGSRAVAPTLLNNPSRTYEMAHGGTGPYGGQPDHWRDESSGNSYIGIMQVSRREGVSAAVNGVYLQPAEVQAFDVMGYSVRVSTIQGPPGAPPLNAPADGAVLPHSDIVLSWSSGANVENYTIAVEDDSLTGDAAIVFAVTEYVDTTITVPASVLMAGHEYVWYVNTCNWRGFLRSEERNFSIKNSCPADFDGNGFVNGTDYDLYVAAFELGDISADFDGDGFVNGADFDLFIIAYEAGC
jgi:hypothetical protein